MEIQKIMMHLYQQTTYKLKKLGFAVILALALICGAYVVDAASPTGDLGFQGQLIKNGSPVNATVNASFQFYDALSGGVAVGSVINKSVVVTNGYFSTTFTEADLTAVDFNQALWVEVVIEGDTLSPRSQVHSVPFARKSFGVFSLGSEPAIGPAGSLYFNNATQKLRVSDGSSWVDVASSTLQWNTSGSNISYSAGRVSVGTTSSPSSLFVQGSAGVNPFVIASSSGQQLLTVTGSGHVGIGTTTPDSTLTVAGATSIFTGSGFEPLTVTRDTESIIYGGGFGGLRIRQTHSPGVAIPNGWGTGIAFALMDRDNNIINNTSSIYSHFEDVTDAGDPAYLTFNTKPTGSGEVERMRITSVGNVGIGSTSPNAKLTVRGDGTTTGVNFQTTNSANARLFTILDNGRVGIGTSSPSHLFTVAGDFNLTGALRASGNSGTSGMVLQTTGTGVQWVATSTLGTGTVQTGTTGQVAFFAADGSIVSGTSTIRIANQNVGISTTTTNNSLQVHGAIGIAGGSLGTLVPNGVTIDYCAGCGNLSRILATNSTIDGGFTRQNTGKLTLAVSNANASNYLNVLTVSDAYVGIGTTTPSSGLTVDTSHATDFNTADSALLLSTRSTFGTAFNMHAGGAGGKTFQLYSSANGNGLVGGGSFYIGDVASNTLRFIINPSGNIGIGSTSPSARLTVRGAGTGTGLNFQTTNSNNVPLTTILDDGRMGLGTTSPVALMHLFRLAGATTTNQNYLQLGHQNIVHGFTDFLPSNSFAGMGPIDTLAGGLYIVGASDTNTEALMFDSYNDSAPVSHATGITFRAWKRSGTGRTALTGNEGVFSVAAGNSALLRLDANGNFGIGTTSPISTLSVRGSGSTNPFTISSSTNAFLFGVNAAGRAGLGAIDSLSSFTISTDSGSLALFQRAAANTSFSQIDIVQPSGFQGSGDGFSLIALGSGYTTSGAFVQDSAFFGANAGLSNGFSIAATNASAPIRFYTGGSSSVNQRMVITSGGNIGIGSTTPGARLAITGAGVTTGINFQTTNSSNVPLFTIFDNGRVGIGSSTPFSTLTVRGSGSDNPFIVSSSTDAVLLMVTNTGNVGIGTTSPTRALVVSGNAQFTAVTSGTYASDLNLTSDGTLTTSASDIRLKENILELATSTLDKLMSLNTYSFTWKADASGKTDIGLIAQEVEGVFPEITFTNPADGYKGINYSRLSTLLLRGMQEQQVQIENLKRYATFIQTKEVLTEKLCLGDTEDNICINKDQLRQLIMQQATPIQGPITGSSGGSTQGDPVAPEGSTETDTNTNIGNGTTDQTTDISSEAPPDSVQAPESVESAPLEPAPTIVEVTE